MKEHEEESLSERIRQAEELEENVTVAILPKDRLKRCGIPDPFDHPWRFLEFYGKDSGCPMALPEPFLAVFSVADFDAPICGDGLYVFHEHVDYGPDGVTPKFLAQKMIFLGAKKMADIITRCTPAYERCRHAATEKEWESSIEELDLFANEYYEQKMGMYVAVYRFLLNHQEIFASGGIPNTTP